MKRAFRYLPLLAVPLLCTQFARAQAGVDINLGFGSAHDSANSGGLDSATGNACTPSSGGTCQSLSALSGFFLGIGGDVMFRKQFGVGADVAFQPARSNYGPFLSRETFFDVDGVYEPVSTKKVSLKLLGGIGVARTGLAFNQSSCIGNVACSSQIVPVATANHFDVHFGAGVQIYVTEHIFIRPEFDLHYAPGLDNVYNSNLVPAGMVWIGYNMGHNQ
jgi:hypothetical protein